ncbi:hypothetical protein HOL34_01270, partial [bacterium]|nr:hypothetical protein [bacterium]
MKKLLLLCTLLGINTQTTCGDYSSYSSYSGGYSDPSSGYTDPNSGYSDPNSGYTDPNSGYTPPATKKYESNPVYTAPDGTQYTTKGTYTTPSTAKYETVQKYNTAQTINNKKYLDSALGNYNSTDAQNLTAKYKSTNHYQISNFLEYVDLSELGPVDRANLEIDYGKINKAIIDIETSITQLHQSLVDFSNQHPKAEVTVSIDNTSSSLTALYLMLISILNGMIQEQYNKLIRANPATTAKFNQFINKINQYDAKINPLAAYFSDAAKARKLYQNPRNQMAFSACALIMRHLAQQQSLTNENLSLAAKAYTQSKTHWDSSIHVPGDKPGTERYELYNNYINIISIAIKQEQAKINVNKAPIIAGDTNNSITTKIADYYQTTSIVYQDLQTLSGQPTSSGRNIQPDDNAALYTRKKSALISALSDYNSRNFDKAAQEFGSASIPLLQLAAELAQAQKKVKSGNSELEAAKAALKAWTNKSWNGLLSSLFGSSLPPNKVSPTRYKSTITELITKLQQAQTNYTTANEAFSKAAQLLIHAQGQPNNNANLMLPSFKSLQNNNASNNAKDCQATVNTISNLITMLNAFTKLSDTNSLNSFETIAKNIALAGRNASASYDHDVQSLLVIPFAQPSSAQPNFVNFANLLAGLYATTRAHNIPGQIKNSQNWYLAALPYLLSNQALTNKVIKDLPATKATSAAKISLNLAKNTPSWANTATKKNQYSSAALSSWHTALSKGMATYVIAAQLPTNNSARQPAISMYTNIAQSFLQATSKVSDASFANTKAMLKPLLLYYKQLVQPNVDTKVVQAVDA